MLPTARAMKNAQRYLDRLRRAKEAALLAMSKGATLHRIHRTGRVEWELSHGERISAEVAHVVILEPNVIGVGDGLFGPELSQTFRWCDSEDSDHG